MNWQALLLWAGRGLLVGCGIVCCAALLALLRAYREREVDDDDVR